MPDGGKRPSEAREESARQVRPSAVTSLSHIHTLSISVVYFRVSVSPSERVAAIEWPGLSGVKETADHSERGEGGNSEGRGKNGSTRDDR